MTSQLNNSQGNTNMKDKQQLASGLSVESFDKMEKEFFVLCDKEEALIGLINKTTCFIEVAKFKAMLLITMQTSNDYMSLLLGDRVGKRLTVLDMDKVIMNSQKVV